MPTRDLFGKHMAEQFIRDLKPEYLLMELKEYQLVFGSEFGIAELLEVKRIEVEAMKAANIADAPEYLCDQIGKARHFSSFNSISGELSDIAEALVEMANNNK